LAELPWLLGHAARVCVGGVPPVVSVIGVVLVVVIKVNMFQMVVPETTGLQQGR